MICFVCEKEIPYGDPKALLVYKNNIVVCGIECAQVIAELLGKKYAVMDDKGNVVETNSFRMN